MIAALESQQQPMTPEEYLLWEPLQEERYEYSGGRIIAMTGGTVPHNDIALNIYSALRARVRAQNCRINVADVKVQVSDAGAYRYPDVVVSCSEVDRNAIKLIAAPTLIVEVLSPGTERQDRGDKLKEYQRLPSLQEYLLIDASQISVERYQGGEGRMWLYFAYALGDTVELNSLDFACPIEHFYEGIQWASQP